MSRENNLESVKTRTDKLDESQTKPDATSANELSDEQIASITGGASGSFPPNGGSGDTSTGVQQPSNNPTP